MVAKTRARIAQAQVGHEVTNPLTLLKLYRKVNALIGLFQKAAASTERADVYSKSLFQSRTFWVNALTIVAEIAQLVSGLRVVPTEYMAVALGIVNVILRSLTNQPVHLVK